MIDYYMTNASIIRNGLLGMGFQVFWRYKCSVYMAQNTRWNRSPGHFLTSCSMMLAWLERPGVGFGPSGEGYFRLTAFGTRENTIKAVERIKDGLRL